MESKKPWQSATLWMNLVLAVLAIAWPKGAEFIQSNPELSAGVVTGLNMVLRWFKSDKKVQLLK